MHVLSHRGCGDPSRGGNGKMQNGGVRTASGWIIEGPDVSVKILPRHLFMVNERELLQGFKSFTF